MSAGGASVPDMADDLGKLAASVTEHAAAHNMTVVPAVPGTDYERAVLVDPAVTGLPEFLELARKLGDGALYLRAEAFSPDPGDVPAHLARRKGDAGELRVAFAAAGHGLLHFWEQTAPWYQEWLDSQEVGLPVGDDEEDRAREQEQDRLTGELADAILADPEFRACSSPAARRRRAQLLVPDGTDRHVGWYAADQARERAEDLSQKAYRPIKDQIDGLAAEFLASPGWRQNASAPARKAAAEPFLIARADGFCPPAFLREELYAKARRLSRSGSGSSGLF